MNLYNILIERLKEISKKEVDFLYLDEIDNVVEFSKGKYFLVAKNLQVETVSINYRKTKIRNISLNYIKANNLIENNLIQEMLEVEDTMHKLSKDEELKKYILDIDYILNVNIKKDNNDDSIKILNIKIDLKIKER